MEAEGSGVGVVADLRANLRLAAGVLGGALRKERHPAVSEMDCAINGHKSYTYRHLSASRSASEAESWLFWYFCKRQPDVSAAK